MLAGWLIPDEEPESATGIVADGEPLDWHAIAAGPRIESRVRNTFLQMHSRQSTMRMTSESRILKPSRS
jgi:hypothetical protein